ncbi:hypothetical protein N9242_06775 [Vicingaceae bacterium]|nr:hypothetical protein [Vicingaceae bacterium]
MFASQKTNCQNTTSRFNRFLPRIIPIYAAWIDDLLAIRAQLNSQSRNIYLQGIESLEAIDESASFVAIEVVLGGHSEAVSRLIVEKLSKLTNVESTDALIRFAIYNPWHGIRKRAANELKSRDRYTVVPTLFGKLKSPIQRRYEIIPGQRGNLVFRQVYSQEHHAKQNVIEFETVYNRVRVGGTRGGDSIKKSIKHMRQSAQENMMAQSMQNLNTQKVNSRVVETPPVR